MKGKEEKGNTLKPGSDERDDSFVPNNMTKDNPFSLPGGYFDTLPGRIRDKIAGERQNAPVRPFPRIILVAASAAAILVIIAFTIFLKSEYDNSGRQRLLSTSENTVNQLAMAANSLPHAADSNKKVLPNVNKPGERNAPAVEPVKKTEPKSNDKQTKVLQTLEKEGISDEDILHYLQEENYDPSEIIN